MAIFNLTANSTFYAEIWDFLGNRWDGAEMSNPSTIASTDWATGMAALAELLTSDSVNTGVYTFAASSGLPKGSYLVAVHSVNTFEPIINAVALMEFTYDGSAEDADTKAVVGAAINDAGLATASTQNAIKTKTDIIGTNAADSPNAVTAQSTIGTNLDAAVSGVKTQTDKLTFDASNNVKSSPQTAATLAANQHVIVDSGTVTSVTNPVTVGTNNDKSGYSIDGASGGTASVASVATADIAADVFKNGTVTLYARVYNDGNNILCADISTLAYSLYLLDDSDKNARTAVEGHTSVSLTVANVIFDTVQTDYAASNYNFKHTPSNAAYPAFTIAGRHYLAEYTITLVSGETIIVRFKVNVL